MTIDEQMKYQYKKNGYLIIKEVVSVESGNYSSRFEQAIGRMARSIGVTKEEYLNVVCRWNSKNDSVKEFAKELSLVVEPF
ncbi:hypothetical protein [Endozoicomonas sp. 2B-B]